VLDAMLRAGGRPSASADELDDLRGRPRPWNKAKLGIISYASRSGGTPGSSTPNPGCVRCALAPSVILLDPAGN
jgi:hypothetical protein